MTDLTDTPLGSNTGGIPIHAGSADKSDKYVTSGYDGLVILANVETCSTVILSGNDKDLSIVHNSLSGLVIISELGLNEIMPLIKDSANNKILLEAINANVDTYFTTVNIIVGLSNHNKTFIQFCRVELHNGHRIKHEEYNGLCKYNTVSYSLTDR